MYYLGNFFLAVLFIKVVGTEVIFFRLYFFNLPATKATFKPKSEIIRPRQSIAFNFCLNPTTSIAGAIPIINLLMFDLVIFY